MFSYKLYINSLKKKMRCFHVEKLIKIKKCSEKSYCISISELRK